MDIKMRNIISGMNSWNEWLIVCGLLGMLYPSCYLEGVKNWTSKSEKPESVQFLPRGLVSQFWNETNIS